jgi:hypothetical protein
MMSKTFVFVSPILHLPPIMLNEKGFKNFLYLRSTAVCKVKGLVDYGSYCLLSPHLTIAIASKMFNYICVESGRKERDEGEGGTTS